MATEGAPIESGLVTVPEAVFNRPWVRYLPLAVFMVYLNLTVALFAFGPWRYPVADGLRLYGFLLLAHLALAAGYVTAAWRVPSVAFGRDVVLRLVKVCLAVTLPLLPLTSLLDTGSLLPNVVGGILDPGGVYAQSIESRSERTLLTIVAYVRILVGPLLFLVFPLVVVYWSWLTTRIRLVSTVALAFVAAIYIAMGVNKGLADMIGLFPPLALAAYFSRHLELTRPQWTRVAAGWVIASALFLWFFAGTQSTRTGSASEHGFLPAGVAAPTPAATPSATPSATPGIASPTPPLASSRPTFAGGLKGISADYDNVLLRYLPSGPLRTGVAGASLYVTHGYYALYLALEKPFVPMFGVGHSIFLTQQAIRLTGSEKIGTLSYPKRIEEDGWDAYGLWSSIYPWLASDLSFPGTILAVFVIGRLFALAWFDSMSGRNPFAYGMLAQFVIMLFYFPANNQTSQSGEGFTAFWIILILWLISRKRSIPFFGRQPRVTKPNARALATSGAATGSTTA